MLPSGREVGDAQPPPRPLSYRELKAEKSNRWEGRRLETRLKVMEKEREHKRHVGSLEKRSVLRQVEDIHRSTGYSPLGLQPERGDRALQDSAYFTTGRKLSEKALGRWKLQEAMAERDLRLSGLEVRRREEQKDALVRLLTDLGVIERRKRSGEAAEAATAGRLRSQSVPVPVGRRSRAATRASDVTAAEAAEAADTSAGRSNGSLARADAVAALSRLQDRQSRIFDERGELVRKATICSGRQADARNADSSASSSADEAGCSQDSDVDEGDPSLAAVEQGRQWMRQLKREAPPGLHEPRRGGGARVHLAVSRATLKQELQQLLRQGRRGVGRMPAMRVVRHSATE